MEAIKKFCGKPMITNLGERDVKQLRSLEVTIVEAHKLNSNKVSHPYCMISLNEVKTCRTKTQEGHSPIWNEEFKFKWVPNKIIFWILSHRMLSGRFIAMIKHTCNCGLLLKKIWFNGVYLCNVA